MHHMTRKRRARLQIIVDNKLENPSDSLPVSLTPNVPDACSTFITPSPPPQRLGRVQSHNACGEINLVLVLKDDEYHEDEEGLDSFLHDKPLAAMKVFSNPEQA